MKKILLALCILFASPVFPGVKQDLEAVGARFEGHGSISGLQRHIKECKYQVKSQSRFVKSLFLPKNSGKLNCILAAKIVIDDDDQEEADKKEAIRTLRDANWAFLTDAQKGKLIKYILRKL